jgi:hypothetical protein
VVGRNGPFLCAEKGWIISVRNDSILATFDTSPSPHGRINAASLLLAFAHIHGEAGKPTEGICSAVVGWNGPFLCAEKGWIISMRNDPILATFDTSPSPHGRINAASLLLAFAHIRGETGKPTLGICSAVVGRNGPFLCAEGVDYIRAKRLHSRHI